MVKFKPYTDKSSLKKYYSRYLQGGLTTKTGRKLSWWERYKFKNKDVNEIEFIIDAVVANRPYILASQFYGNAQLEWVILQYNNIVDIQEEFAVGKTIYIPSYSYVMSNIITKSGIHN